MYTSSIYPVGILSVFLSMSLLFLFSIFNNVEEFTGATIKKGMVENNKSMADAKTDEEKGKIVIFIFWTCCMIFQKPKKQNATTGLWTCNNILTMTKPLYAKVPSFIGDKRINLSWKEVAKTAPSTTPTAGYIIFPFLLKIILFLFP
ncbi:unnamed protein product [Lupinus luteus]|uniref:ATP synthase F0 subunit 8 n=1 Tax=Lupinus luteus TaxID=3873 RepID=A0AAV1WSJ0_LUPLU